MNPDAVNILAVDDIPDNLLILESLLADVEGYNIDCVQDGESALTAIAQRPPDLILLDVMMPGLNGYQVTQRIRADKGLPYIPILLVTAHDSSSLSQGLDSGADDFIRKPYDINELMARVRSLLRLKQSLDEQTLMIRQRDDFVARLTHDLRTPLVAANRMLSLSLEGVFGDPSEEMAEAIGSVITNNENLLKMTNTLLQVYRHEAGQKKLVRSRLSAYQLAKEIVQELKPLADDKNIDLTLQLVAEHSADSDGADSDGADSDGADSDGADSDGVQSDSRAGGTSGSTSDRQEPQPGDYQVEGDRIELRRLLTNLIGNAIKFTDSGRISVQLSINADACEAIATPEAVEIAIQDTGVGIEQAAQEKIFDWFYQGDHMRAGSGLGLHLSKRIAEMHEGTLTVASELGKGSTFTLALPRVMAPVTVSAMTKAQQN